MGAERAPEPEYGAECINGCGRMAYPGNVVFMLTSNGWTCLECILGMLDTMRVGLLTEEDQRRRKAKLFPKESQRGILDAK